MANIKPYVKNTLPGTLDAEGLYFIKHPLNPQELVIHLTTNSGTTTRSTPVSSPMQKLEPPLHNRVELVYVDDVVTEKRFFIDTTLVGKVTFTYNQGNLIEKKLYIGTTFSGKIVYTYTDGTLSAKTYSTVEGV